jgi:hypothetical protein
MIFLYINTCTCELGSCLVSVLYCLLQEERRVVVTEDMVEQGCDNHCT